MFTHIMVGSNNLAESKTFYDATLANLAIKEGMFDKQGRCFYMSKTGLFGITKPIDGEAACHANGGTIGFAAASPEAVDAWHAAGLENGGSRCEEPPGPRDAAFGKLYLAYLRDPSGNKLCATYKY